MPTAALDFATDAEDERRALDCLTAAIYYEARSEPDVGQRAVAQVVLNRVRNPAFPDSVCGVVYQRSAEGCQFTFVCDGSTAYRREPAAWEHARTIAAAALSGDGGGPVGGATYYHTRAVLPWWSAGLARIGEIGAHIFYGRGQAVGGGAAMRRYGGVEPLIAATQPIATGPALPAVARITKVAGGAVAVHVGNDDPASAVSIPLEGGVRVHRLGQSGEATAAAEPSADGVAVHVGQAPDAAT